MTDSCVRICGFLVRQETGDRRSMFFEERLKCPKEQELEMEGGLVIHLAAFGRI